MATATLAATSDIRDRYLVTVPVDIRERRSIQIQDAFLWAVRPEGKIAITPMKLVPANDVPESVKSPDPKFVSFIRERNTVTVPPPIRKIFQLQVGDQFQWEEMPGIDEIILTPMRTQPILPVFDERMLSKN